MKATLLKKLSLSLILLVILASCGKKPEFTWNPDLYVWDANRMCFVNSHADYMCIDDERLEHGSFLTDADCQKLYIEISSLIVSIRSDKKRSRAWDRFHKQDDSLKRTRLLRVGR